MPRTRSPISTHESTVQPSSTEPPSSTMPRYTYRDIEVLAETNEATEIVHVVWPQPLVFKRSDNLNVVVQPSVPDIPAAVAEQLSKVVDERKYQGEIPATSRVDRLLRDLKVERELENILNRMREGIENEIVVQRMERGAKRFTTSSSLEVDNRKEGEQGTNQQFLNQEFQNF